jgi:hypothetical protein
MTGTIEIPDGSQVLQWTIPAGQPPYVGHMFLAAQIVDPPSGTPGEVTVTINVDSVAGERVILVNGITCYEIPRTLLEDMGAVTAVDLDSLDANRLIYEVTNRSAHSVSKAAREALVHGRRAALLSVYYPPGAVITETSFTSASRIFEHSAAYDPPVMPRHLYDGDASRIIRWAAYVASSGGAPGGTFRASSVTPASTSDMSIPAGPTWVESSIEAEDEDPSRLAIDGGIRGGTRNTIYGQAIRDAGATNVTVYGFCAGVAAALVT